MKKLLRFLVLFLLVGILLMLGMGLALGLYYRNHFPVNTWINGVYCTGKTLEQVNRELSQKTDVPAAVIVGMDGRDGQLDLRRAEGRADYTAVLVRYLYKNAFLLWAENLREPVREELEADSYVYDRDKLREDFEELDIISEARKTDPGVRLIRSVRGYELQDGNTAHLDVEQAFAYLEECLSRGECHVDLADGNCYTALEDSEYDEHVRMIWERLQEYTDRSIVYELHF